MTTSTLDQFIEDLDKSLGLGDKAVRRDCTRKPLLAADELLAATTLWQQVEVGRSCRFLN